LRVNDKKFLVTFETFSPKILKSGFVATACSFGAIVLCCGAFFVFFSSMCQNRMNYIFQKSFLTFGNQMFKNIGILITSFQNVTEQKLNKGTAQNKRKTNQLIHCFVL